MDTVHKPTRNPLRIVAAAWRLTKDLSQTEDATLVEMTFFKSRLFRRYARWDEAAHELRTKPTTRDAFEKRPRVGAIDVTSLSELPVGTLGHTLAAHLIANGLNPYLFDPIPDDSDGDYVLGHLLETHDIWHIVTGLSTDVPGEFALVAFYAAQTGLTSTSMLLTFGFANTTLFAPHELRTRLSAVAKGWNLGMEAQPLFGVDWNSLWDLPLTTVRQRFGLPEGDHARGRSRAAA